MQLAAVVIYGGNHYGMMIKINTKIVHVISLVTQKHKYKCHMVKSSSSLQGIIAIYRNSKTSLKSDMTAVLRNICSYVALDVRSLTGALTSLDANVYIQNKVWGSDTIGQACWAFVSRRFWDILVYSRSLIIKVSQWSSLRNRCLPHCTVISLDIGHCVSYRLIVTVRSLCASYCIAPSITTWHEIKIRLLCQSFSLFV